MSIAPAVNAWFRANARDLPWRRAGFPPWGTLVSEFMLQQTPVARVIPRLEEWLRRWPEPAALASAAPGDAVRAWDRLGYPRRALNLHAAATAITERHGGVVPHDVEELLALPGVGPYTARAVAVFAFGLRHPVVDVNVRRVIARAVSGHAQPGPASPRDLAGMDALLPDGDDAAAEFNAGMMELGAVVCTARSPRCGECPIAAACAWRAAGYPEGTGPRARVQKRFEGSDRQARGMLLALLRGSADPVAPDALEAALPDPERCARALHGLLRDGLVVADGGHYRLP